MNGGTRRTSQIRSNPPEPDPRRPSRVRYRNRDHGPIRLINVKIRTLLGLGFGLFAILFVAYLVYSCSGGVDGEAEEIRKLMRVVTPLNAPKMLDLPQFQGEHKESLYWGTYRPQVYLGIQARCVCRSKSSDHLGGNTSSEGSESDEDDQEGSDSEDGSDDDESIGNELGNMSSMKDWEQSDDDDLSLDAEQANDADETAY